MIDKQVGMKLGVVNIISSGQKMTGKQLNNIELELGLLLDNDNEYWKQEAEFNPMIVVLKRDITDQIKGHDPK